MLSRKYLYDFILWVILFSLLASLSGCIESGASSGVSKITQSGTLVIPENYLSDPLTSSVKSSIQIRIDREDLPENNIFSHYQETGYSFLLLFLKDEYSNAMRSRDNETIQWVKDNIKLGNVEKDPITGMYKIYKNEISFMWYLVKDTLF